MGNLCVDIINYIARYCVAFSGPIILYFNHDEKVFILQAY